MAILLGKLCDYFISTTSKRAVNPSQSLLDFDAAHIYMHV